MLLLGPALRNCRFCASVLYFPNWGFSKRREPARAERCVDELTFNWLREQVTVGLFCRVTEETLWQDPPKLFHVSCNKRPRHWRLVCANSGLPKMCCCVIAHKRHPQNWTDLNTRKNSFFWYVSNRFQRSTTILDINFLGFFCCK